MSIISEKDDLYKEAKDLLSTASSMEVYKKIIRQNEYEIRKCEVEERFAETDEEKEKWHEEIEKRRQVLLKTHRELNEFKTRLEQAQEVVDHTLSNLRRNPEISARIDEILSKRYARKSKKVEKEKDEKIEENNKLKSIKELLDKNPNTREVFDQLCQTKARLKDFESKAKELESKETLTEEEKTKLREYNKEIKHMQARITSKQNALSKLTGRKIDITALDSISSYKKLRQRIVRNDRKIEELNSYIQDYSNVISIVNEMEGSRANQPDRTQSTRPNPINQTEPNQPDRTDNNLPSIIIPKKSIFSRIGNAVKNIWNKIRGRTMEDELIYRDMFYGGSDYREEEVEDELIHSREGEVKDELIHSREEEKEKEFRKIMQYNVGKRLVARREIEIARALAEKRASREETQKRQSTNLQESQLDER